ncbi:MAG: glycosyltransferase family 4 protein [Planctomycetota bacterium]
MRVLRIVTRPNVGGPMRQAISLWRAHSSLGVETLLAVGRCGRGEARFDLGGCGIPVLAFADALARGRRASGIVEIPCLQRAWHPLRDSAARRALSALIEAFRPDVVHTHTSKAGWLGRNAARGRAVTAHTFHGHVLKDYFGRSVSRILTRIERRWAERTDLLFSVSESCRRELCELGVADASRIEVLPPAVDCSTALLSRQDARAELGIDPGAFACVFAGRLVAVKRVAHFVRALGDGMIGDVFGDGPEGDLVQKQGIRRLATRADLPRLLPAYDALLLSSIREGFPLVAVEAFAAGVPVVGYRVPGVEDALSDGRGILVPEEQGPAGLRAALERLRRDAELRESLVAKGRSALFRFDPKQIAARLLARYQSAGRSVFGYACRDLG